MSALPQPALAPDEAADELVARHEADPDWLDAFAEAFERRRVVTTSSGSCASGT
jgi:hypothetical protein